MTVANAKPDQLIRGPLGTTTVNAASSAWWDVSTVEAKISEAIAYAVSIGAKYCYVPDCFLPYTASLVTFNTAVGMTREGGASAPWADVLAYGADPAFALDSTAAIQAAVNYIQAQGYTETGQTTRGGTVYFPRGAYLTSATITVTGNNVRFMGEAFAQEASPTAPPSLISLAAGSSFNGNLVTITNTKCFQMWQLGLQGQGTGNTQGVFGTGCQNTRFYDCFFNSFGLSAIQLTSIQDVLVGLTAQNCLLSNPSVDTGVFDLTTTDTNATGCMGNASIAVSAGNLGNGHRFGWAIRGGNGSFWNCWGDQSHHGWLVTGIQNRFMGSRAFQNQGNGFVFGAAATINTVVGCHAISNSQNADNGSAGFKVMGGGNTFIGCIVDGNAGDARQQSNGFDDTSTLGNGETQINHYSTNRIGANMRGVLYNLSDGQRHRVEHPHKITPNVGDAGVTVTWGVDGDTVMFQSPLTSARVCTLANNGTLLVPKGARFRVVRTAAATGASTLTVTGGDSKVLAVGQWVDFEYSDESQWREVAFGSL